MLQVDYDDTDTMKSPLQAKDMNGAGHLSAGDNASTTNPTSAVPAHPASDTDNEPIDIPADTKSVSFDARDLSDFSDGEKPNEKIASQLTDTPFRNKHLSGQSLSQFSDTPYRNKHLSGQSLSQFSDTPYRNKHFSGQSRTYWCKEIPEAETPEVSDSEEDPATQAPDGGWGWVVVAAAFFLYIILGAIWFSFSVLYHVYVDHFQASLATIGMIASVEALVLHMTGEPDHSVIIISLSLVHRNGIQSESLVCLYLLKLQGRIWHSNGNFVENIYLIVELHPDMLVADNMV